MASQETWSANERERRLVHLAARLRDAWYAFAAAWAEAGLSQSHVLFGMVAQAAADTGDLLARVADDSRLYHDHARRIAERWRAIHAEAARARRRFGAGAPGQRMMTRRVH